MSFERTNRPLTSTEVVVLIQSDEETHPSLHESVATLAPTERTPLPKLQLLVIFMIQISEPITGTVIYPFINQFVRDTGVTGGNEGKTGYYAGAIESLFFVSEALTVFQWGWLSDRLGRKPVLMIGPLGLAVAMIGFGLSKTYGSLMAFRCFQGVFNGNIGVSKSVMAEISDESNMGDVFSMMPMMWSVGITLGPIIGGIFANPAQRMPGSLGKIQLLKDHPYLLPCLLAACISLAAFMIGTIGLKETRIITPPIRQKLGALWRKRGDTWSSPPSYPDSDGANLIEADEASSISQSTFDERDPPPPPSIRSLFIRPMILTFSNYFFIAFMDMANAALLPLMFSTSISLGGLGFDAHRIGLLLGIFGTINATLQLKFLGKLIRTYGPRTVYICSYMAFIICIGLFPITSHFAQKSGRVDGVVWALVLAQLAAQAPILACYSCIQVLVTRNAPSKEALGTTNGVGQLIASSMRSIAPSVASSLFSLSIEKQLAGGFLVYYVLLFVVLVGMRLSWLLPRGFHSDK